MRNAQPQHNKLYGKETKFSEKLKPKFQNFAESAKNTKNLNKQAELYLHGTVLLM